MGIKSESWGDPLPAAAEPLPAGDALQDAIIEATLAQQELDRQAELKRQAAQLAKLQQAQADEEKRQELRTQIEAAIPELAQVVAEHRPHIVDFQARLIGLAHELRDLVAEYQAVKARQRAIEQAKEHLRALDQHYHAVGRKWNLEQTVTTFLNQAPSDFPALAVRAGLVDSDLEPFPKEPGPLTRVLIEILRSS